jgi:hypothetical protein
MRTSPRVAVGTAVVLTAVATWSLAQTGGAVAADDGHNLEFFIQDTKQATVDSPPTGTSQGDLFAYHGLMYEKKGGKTIGRFGGACVQLDAAGGAPSDSSCSVDYILPDGQLHTEIFGANDFLFSGKSFPFSILGGTGKYRDARGDGTMRIPTDVKNQTDGYVKIKLDG